MLSTSLKERALRVVGRLLRSGPGARVARGYFDRRASLIFYHGVWEPGSPRGRLIGGLDADRFAAHLRVLRGFFEFVELGRILGPLDGDGRPHRPRLHLTFDDGLDLIGGGAT